MLLAVLCRVHVASGQTGFAPDTITPHYARFNDELPALLSSMSSVLQSGLDSSDRAWLIGEVAKRRPRQPLGRAEYGRPMTYQFTTGFGGRDEPLWLGVYWIDTSTVAISVRSRDKELASAIAMAVFDARVAKLVSPDTVRISLAELEPYGGAEGTLGFTMTSPSAPHCRGFGIERRFRSLGDTLFVQLLGVPAPGDCPNAAGLRGSTVALFKQPGRHVIVFDSRGDTNVVTLVVTDTSFALEPVKTTYVHAEQTVKWRYPSASLTLRCRRDAGDPHFCDALHEFIQAQPGIRPFSFPAGGVNPLGSGSAAERRMVYHYAEEGTAAKVRRCVASFPAQTRLDSWVKLHGRPVAGRWWAESPSGTSNSLTARRAPAEGLDASGDVLSSCGDEGIVAEAGNAHSRLPVRTTHMSTFAFKRTNPTTVSARSDGWIVLTPLTGSMGGPDSTTHLYARAADAQRWVQRVHDVLSGGSFDRYASELGRFIPQLGRGTVKVETRVTDSARYQKVSFGLTDCRGLHRSYNVDGSALLMIAAYVEWAAEVALRESTIPLPPTLEHPYESNEVSCPAVALDDSTRSRYSVLQRNGKFSSVRFVVDTAGRVEERSITFAAGTDHEFEAAARADVARWRYRPAEWAGIRVRQTVNMTPAPKPTMSTKSNSALQAPRVDTQVSPRVHLGTRPVLPDSINESLAGGRFSIFVLRTTHDTAERRMLETAERLIPERSDIEREAKADTAEWQVRAFASAAALPGDRWWWREWSGVLLPYSLTGATVEHYLARVRALGAGPHPFTAPGKIEGPPRVSFRYVATVERMPTPGVAYRVTLRMDYDHNCGLRCGFRFTKDRVVAFDAAGRVLNVSGDSAPFYINF